MCMTITASLRASRVNELVAGLGYYDIISVFAAKVFKLIGLGEMCHADTQNKKTEYSQVARINTYSLTG